MGRLSLRFADGTIARDPFVDPVLWSSDGSSLTLILDPSRQKRGLRAHDLFGYVLPARGLVSLSLDGRPIKTWRIAGPSCPKLQPRRWSIGAIMVGTRAPLAIALAAPIDILSRERIAVITRERARAAGTIRLDRNERRWLFFPAAPWRGGERIAVHPRLEDPCGDEVDEPFEHDPARSLASRRPPLFLRIPVHKRDT